MSRVAELTGRDKTVISRTLATLADAGIVARDSKRRTYRIGPRLYALASRTQESALAARARPHLRRVAGRIGETTHLSILHDGNVLTLVSELSRRELRTSGWEGLTTAAWRTPSGRILLSGWDEQELAAWYAIHGHDQPIPGPGRSESAPPRFGIPETPPPGSAVVQNLADLRAEISRIRATRYALSDEELELGVVAASAPVTDPTGHIIAALNISAPKSRVAVGLDRLGDYVATAAAQLSTHLGTPPNNLPDHTPRQRLDDARPSAVIAVEWVPALAKRSTKSRTSAEEYRPGARQESHCGRCRDAQLVVPLLAPGSLKR